MKFIDLKAQYLKIKEEIDSGIHEVLEHGQYIMGPEVSTLETNLSKFVQQKHSITCSSGTDALLMSLMAMEIKPGDFVLTTPFTYIATAEVISLLGAVPDFVDIDPRTFNIDVNQVEKKIISNPQKYKIIMPVNIFGLLADYEHLLSLKNNHNFNIIEDAAQSFGASNNHKVSCGFGDISCTSFFPAKPLGCYGDGGAIFTNNEKYAEKLKSIRIHGKGKDKYNNVRVGINGRLDTLQAAILIPKLKIFKDEINSRNRVAELYNANINDSYEKQYIPPGNISAWAQYSMLAKSTNQRDKVISELKNNNIPSAIYYITPLHLQTVYKGLGYSNGDYPISEDISSRIFSIPMHPYLEEKDINNICEIINAVQ